MDIYFKSVGRGMPLLLNILPNREGRFVDEDIKRLYEFKENLDAMYAKNLAAEAIVEVDSTRQNELYASDHLVDESDKKLFAFSGDTTTGSITVDLGSERRIRQYANELGYTLQNFRLDNGAFLAEVDADFSQPLPEPEQPEDQPVCDVEARFEFNFADGLAHHGSLGYFTTLEQAERRIRHFANEQGYTLLNLRIEDGKFVADVKE